MSTLPRTRSLSGADTVSLSGTYRDRLRPASLCENSWHKIVSPGDNSALSRQGVLKRTPSQANSLSTTVPTSLVSRNLSKRHVPTRTSLKHSRMLNIQQKSKVFVVRRQPVGGVGRIGILVLAAQIFVGGAGVLLACWLLLWAPNLTFRVVPHYAGVPVLLSGVFGSILLCCLSGKKSCGVQTIRSIVFSLCCISILTCTCVCVFTALHLIRLAPMDCSPRSSVLQIPLHTTTTTEPTLKGFKSVFDTDVYGSGDNGRWDDEDDEDRELDGDAPPPERYYGSIILNKSICICERLREGWRTVDRYELTCAEVKNILPIFFVASIIVCAVGCVLCVVIIYMLWIARIPKHKPSEARPFIYKSQFKKRRRNSQSRPNGDGGRNSSLYR